MPRRDDDHLTPNTGASAPEWLIERVGIARAGGDAARPDADELAPHDLAAAMARVDADPDAGERLDALARSDAEILAAHPPDQVVAEIERRLRVAAARADAAGRASGSRTPWWRGWGLAAAGAACAAAVAVVMVRGDGSLPVASDGVERADGVRAKGDDPGDLATPDGAPRLVVHRLRGDGSETLADGAEVRAGDRLQLAYVAGGYRYGAIVSIDGRGVVTLHYPEQPGGDAALATRGPTLLAGSYELDDAPAFERFVFVASRAPIDVAAVVTAAERLAADPDAARRDSLPLSGGAGDASSQMQGRMQRSILLRKPDDR